MKSRSASKIKLTSYDDLIGGAVSKNDIQEIPIGQLRDFVNHPFQVNDDDEMNELVESIKTQGVLTALLVRPSKKGGYEIVSGHRRKHAAVLAGLTQVPVIIREMSDDDAVRAMVDSNLQREHDKPYPDQKISYIELVDHYLADDCQALGFQMDCGHAFSEKYGDAVSSILYFSIQIPS